MVMALPSHRFALCFLMSAVTGVADNATVASELQPQPCVDRDDRWVAHNTTCQRMRRLCDDTAYGALVRSWCPRSCGACNTTEAASDEGGGADFPESAMSGNSSHEEESTSIRNATNATTTTSTCPARGIARAPLLPAAKRFSSRMWAGLKRSMANTSHTNASFLEVNDSRANFSFLNETASTAPFLLNRTAQNAGQQQQASRPILLNMPSKRDVVDSPLKITVTEGAALPGAPFEAFRNNGTFRHERPADLVLDLQLEDDDLEQSAQAQWASAAAALAFWALPDNSSDTVVEGDSVNLEEESDTFDEQNAQPVFSMPDEEFFPSGCRFRAEGAAADLPMGGSPYTIEAWVMPDEDIKHGGIVGWGEWGAHGSVQAFRFADIHKLKNYWWGNALVAETPASLADGEYHHVAATWDGAVRRIFVDFREVAQQVTSGYAVSRKDNFCIGQTNNNEHFRGRIKDLKIWKFARSAAEMAQSGDDKKFKISGACSGSTPCPASKWSAKSEGVSFAIEEEIHQCPPGYERLLGDVFGGDQFSGGYKSSATSIEDCARQCAYTAGCGSFEFSPTTKRCYRNSQTKPTHEVQRYDFIFCRRAPCPSFKTEERCVGPSVSKASHSEEVAMRRGGYCIWSGGTCQAPLACTANDCFLPDGGLPGMELPDSQTLWITYAGLQATMLPSTTAGSSAGVPPGGFTTSLR